METYYTVYQTTNKINGRIYIGCHKTNDLDDGYIGSGKILKRAIKKYGIENFEKIILEIFDNPNDMFEMEAKLVCVDDPNTYNIKEGGCGVWPNDVIDMTSRNQRIAAKRSYQEPAFLAAMKLTRGRPKSIETRRKMSEAQKGEKNHFYGKTHSDQIKQQISNTKKGTGLGKNNTQYGTMWIRNLDLKKCKKIKKGDPIPEGWERGYRLKW